MVVLGGVVSYERDTLVQALIYFWWDVMNLAIPHGTKTLRWIDAQWALQDNRSGLVENIPGRSRHQSTSGPSLTPPPLPDRTPGIPPVSCNASGTWGARAPSPGLKWGLRAPLHF